MNKRINIKLVASCVLSVALVTAPVALAQYVPPPNPTTPAPPSTIGGRRGCDGKDMPLTVLASRKYIAKTISRRPTFAWFVPDSGSFEMEFTIAEISPSGKKGKEELALSLPSSPGIMKLSPFSNDVPGLEVGKEYFWEVAINCSNDLPDTPRLVDGASIEVVEIPPAVQSQLNKAVNSVEKTTIYAKAGLWYDALGEALKLAKPSKLGEVGSSLLKDLAKWEAPEVTPEWMRNQCERNNSEKGMPETAQKPIPPECRRNDLEQIANRER